MICQIKISLNHIRPPIWRRVQVASDTTFATLHDMIQVVMGWENGHLHEFKAAGRRIRPEMDDDFSGGSTFDEMDVKIGDVIKREKAKLTYTYDFGDGWEHTLTIEKIAPPEMGIVYPICLKGKRACPPEDCGGPWGYGALLEAQKHPDDPRNQELLEWSADFDPEAFDLGAINAQLKRLR